jgi:hypothetical protein
MRTIVIRVPAADLAAEMAAMRKWLDARTCEPSRFTSRRHGSVLTVCVEFNNDGDGEAFKAHFDREIRRRAGVETGDRMADDLERRLAQYAR